MSLKMQIKIKEYLAGCGSYFKVHEPTQNQIILAECEVIKGAHWDETLTASAQDMLRRLGSRPSIYFSDPSHAFRPNRCFSCSFELRMMMEQCVDSDTWWI